MESGDPLSFSHVDSLTSIRDIRDALSQIEAAEQKTEKQLYALVETEPELEKEMKKIQTAIPTVEALQCSSRLVLVREERVLRVVVLVSTCQRFCLVSGLCHIC